MPSSFPKSHSQHRTHSFSEMNPEGSIISEEDFEDEMDEDIIGEMPEELFAERTRYGMHPQRGELLDQNNEFLQAYTALNVAMVVVPVIAGLDKFTFFLTDWSQYLAPVFPKILGVSKMSFMHGVGLLEIALGLGVAFKPKFFGYVLCGWFGAILFNIFVLSNFFDVAIHDFALALGAFALAKLAQARDRNITVIEPEKSQLLEVSPVLH